MEDFNVCASTSYKRYAESDSDEGDAVNPNDFLKIRATINKRQKVDNGNASLSAAKEFHSETEDDLFPLNSREDFINAAVSLQSVIHHSSSD